MADDVLRVFEYLEASGEFHSHAGLIGLMRPAGARVRTALYRLAHGNFSSVKGVGAGVYEYKIDFGPGYRIYFGRDGDRVIILLGGSEKKRQWTAIRNAQALWTTYKRRKTSAGKD